MNSKNRQSTPSMMTRLRPVALVTATGLALGVASTAQAVSRARQTLRISRLANLTGSDAQASTIVVGNIEGGHVWPNNVVFNNRVTQVWWSANDVFGIPDAGVARGMFYTAHATAAASALAGNEPTIANAPLGFFPPSIIGFAPDAKMILSAGFATGFNSTGTFDGVTDNSSAFAIFALTDPKIASFASALLNIPPYEVATVVNASFGALGAGTSITLNYRVGESMLSHAFDATVWRNDTVIVVAAGDEDQNAALEAEMNMDPMDPGGTVGAPGSAWNMLAVGRLDQNGTTGAMESSKGPVGVIDWRASGITMLSSILPQTFGMCMLPSSLPEQLASTRSVVQVAAPGTVLSLASNLAFPDPSTDPAGTGSIGPQMWTGTSFSSAIVAGIAAMVQDIGTKNNLWPVDAQGNSKPSGLATRAILLNSADQRTATLSVDTMNNGMGSEADACIFSKPLDDKIGLGVISPERIKIQMFGKFDPQGVGGLQANDVRADNPMHVDGVDRMLLGVTRGNFDSTPDDPHDYFRDPPPSFDPAVLANTMNPPPIQDEQIGDWYTNWDASHAIAAVGTDMDTPFVTEFRRPFDGGLGVMAPGAADPDLGSSAQIPASAPAQSATTPARRTKTKSSGKSGYKPYGQPGGLVGPPDPNLENDRFNFGSGGLGPVPGAGPSTGGNGQGGGGNSFGQRVKSGWDVGRMGVGFIDYPVGLISPMSTIHATLVWNRTEIWDDQDLNSWSTDVFGAFKKLDSKKIRPVMSLAENDQANQFPSPELSPDGRELPTIQKAFALENLDLELWRQGVGGTGNVIIAASRQEWSDIEHFSVGPDAPCDPDNNSMISFGNYFIRVLFKDELFDLGGYRYCSDVQSLAMVSDALFGGPPGGNPDGHFYQNMYPGEVPFAVAWYIELMNNPGLNLVQQAGLDPADMNGDGVVDDDDVESMALATLGDLNGDHLVDSSDLAILLSKFGSDELLYDLNRDGSVNGGDIARLLAAFGTNPIVN